MYMACVRARCGRRETKSEYRHMRIVSIGTSGVKQLYRIHHIASHTIKYTRTRTAIRADGDAWRAHIFDGTVSFLSVGGGTQTADETSRVV